MLDEPRTKDDYSPRQVEAAERVIVDVMQVLASFKDCLVLVGGWVPVLTIEDPAVPHSKSTDVDLALDVDKLADGRYALKHSGQDEIFAFAIDSARTSDPYFMSSHPSSQWRNPIQSRRQPSRGLMLPTPLSNVAHIESLRSLDRQHIARIVEVLRPPPAQFLHDDVLGGG